MGVSYDRAGRVFPLANGGRMGGLTARKDGRGNENRKSMPLAFPQHPATPRDLASWAKKQTVAHPALDAPASRG